MSNIIRMTPDQLRRVKALIKNQCCNYDDGDCLLLDCPCPQMITYSLICKWSKTAVLPNNKELYIQLIKSVNTKGSSRRGSRAERPTSMDGACSILVFPEMTRPAFQWERRSFFAGCLPGAGRFFSERVHIL